MKLKNITISPILLEKLQKLSPTQQQQIEDYLDFIIQKYEKNHKNPNQKKKNEF